MSILTIVLTIVIVGVILWGINTAIPMQAQVKTILNVLVVVLLLLWILEVFGVIGPWHFERVRVR